MTNDGPGHHDHHGTGGLGVGREGWDERYSAEDQIWSGQPNGVLVAEVADERPGRALDVGCGEGADAVWLALRSWSVTALDVSEIALERARKAAAAAGAEIEWVHAGLLDADLPPRSFDLVSAQYPALLRTPDQQAERALLDAVAPGGTLLVVHHGDMDVEEAKSHGFDPEDYVQPDQVLAALDGSWTVEADEVRPREVTSGGGARHHVDRVLRARRLEP
jgi:SAM-dependent methyltransferase